MTLTGSNQEKNGNLTITNQDIPIAGGVNIDGSSTLHGYYTLPNFPGSIIIKTKSLEGNIVGYAIRTNSKGKLEGNRIDFGQNGEIKFTYQLHNLSEEKLEELGIYGEYQNAVLKENNEKMDKTKVIIMGLYIKGTGFDPFQGVFPPKKEYELARNSITSFNVLDQIELAKYFFNKTIGENIGNLRNAYAIYGLFIDLPFGWQFWDMEDKRLKSLGYKEGFYNLKPRNYKNSQ